jgi:predicted DNA-binding transcriptional regulator AlpA
MTFTSRISPAAKPFSTNQPGPQIGPGKRLLRFKQHCEAAGYSTKTGDRRARSDPDFPRIVKLHRQRYIIQDEHEAYIELLIRRGLGVKP